MSWIDELRRLLRRAKESPPMEEPSGEGSCHDALERIFDWLDGELAPDQEASVGAHLQTCGRCYPVLKFEKAFLEALARVAEKDEVPEELQGKVLRSLETEGFSNP
jgi:anti-sigma factor (TIGR02949 family)